MTQEMAMWFSSLLSCIHPVLPLLVFVTGFPKPSSSSRQFLCAPGRPASQHTGVQVEGNYWDHAASRMASMNENKSWTKSFLPSRFLPVDAVVLPITLSRYHCRSYISSFILFQ